MEKFGLVVFETTHCAIKSESVVKENNLKARLIGAPESIVSGCGLSLKFELKDLDKIKELLKSNNINYKGFYEGEKEGFRSNYSQIN